MLFNLKCIKGQSDIVKFRFETFSIDLNIIDQLGYKLSKDPKIHYNERKWILCCNPLFLFITYIATSSLSTMLQCSASICFFSSMESLRRELNMRFCTQITFAYGKPLGRVAAAASKLHEEREREGIPLYGVYHRTNSYPTSAVGCAEQNDDAQWVKICIFRHFNSCTFAFFQ